MQPEFNPVALCKAQQKTYPVALIIKLLNIITRFFVIYSSDIILYNKYNLLFKDDRLNSPPLYTSIYLNFM